MPNYVQNVLEFNGSEKDIKQLIDSITTEPIRLGDDNNLTFNKVIPIPKSEEENWYNWRIANWGTKWDAIDGFINDDMMTIGFSTAWSTPYPFLLELSKQNPNVEINVKYSDEDFGHNVGDLTFLNGEETKTYVPLGGSIDALLMAIDIQYGDIKHWIDGELEYISEYHYEDEYFKNTLEIMYIDKYVPCIGQFEDNEVMFHHIIDFLETKALENEEYEYLDKLKKVNKID